TGPAQTSARIAIRVARRKARELVRRVEKGGEKLADIANNVTASTLMARRMSFLDLSEDAERETITEPTETTVVDAIEAGIVKPVPTVLEPTPEPDPEPATPVLDRQRFADIDIDWS
ncbi:MAG: hypothetical protein ACYTAN_17570, partial [Planctomycetota bacterium]